MAVQSLLGGLCRRLLWTAVLTDLHISHPLFNFYSGRSHLRKFLRPCLSEKLSVNYEAKKYRKTNLTSEIDYQGGFDEFTFDEKNLLTIQSEVPILRPYRDQKSPVEELDDGHLDERSQVINQNQPAQPQLIEDNRSEVLSRHLQSSLDRPQDQNILGVKSVLSKAQMAGVTKGCLE